MKFVKKNVFENVVCKLVAILLQTQCAKVTLGVSKVASMIVHDKLVALT